jgi:hypothetical protein
MAVVKVPYHDVYVGLSTDDKPTGVLPGSIFYAVNTGDNTAKKYITPDDGTNWGEITAEAGA